MKRRASQHRKRGEVQDRQLGFCKKGLVLLETAMRGLQKVRFFPKTATRIWQKVQFFAETATSLVRK